MWILYELSLDTSFGPHPPATLDAVAFAPSKWRDQAGSTRLTYVPHCTPL